MKLCPAPIFMRVLARELQHGIIRAGGTHQAQCGGFAESQPELDARDGVDQRFVDVLHGLDEMGLPEDEVDLFRFLDLHAFSSICRS